MTMIDRQPQPPRRKRISITFKEDDEVIEPRQTGISAEERTSAWYGSRELRQFRKNARFVSETLQSSHIFRTPGDMLTMVSQYGIDHEDITTTRGLEMLMCSQRQQRCTSAVKAILQAYEENKHDDCDNGLFLEVVRKFSKASQQIAYDHALEDQDEASKCFCPRGSIQMEDTTMCQQRPLRSLGVGGRRWRGSLIDFNTSAGHLTVQLCETVAI
jgi:hypothetical protein